MCDANRRQKAIADGDAHAWIGGSGKTVLLQPPRTPADPQLQTTETVLASTGCGAPIGGENDGRRRRLAPETATGRLELIWSTPAEGFGTPNRATACEHRHSMSHNLDAMTGVLDSVL